MCLKYEIPSKTIPCATDFAKSLGILQHIRHMNYLSMFLRLKQLRAGDKELRVAVRDQDKRTNKS